MLRLFYSKLLYIAMTVFFSLTTAAQDVKLNSHPNGGFGMPETWGEATNCLQPDILIEKHGVGWQIDINLYAQTNFLKNTWLKITNRIGSKLQLWLTNGMELPPTNPAVLAAMNLPSRTTVSDIMRNVHPSNTRGLQWLPVVGQGMVAGEFYTSAGFNLQSAFDVSFTNDVVLQITPLIYKVETNEITADLVEFPPIKIKLLASGEAKKIEE
jgi:hypothetical protein